MNMTPKQLDEKLKSKHPPFVLDVREPIEYETANIGGKLIPLGQVMNRLEEIPRDREIVVHCHHGGRSRKCIEMLQTVGFTQLSNLEGGIDRWSIEVDPSVKRY
jgi:sulfur-carrier protein adenylyltransferase/sulfurtransferase